MKKFDKWFFPDKEEHLQDWMTKRNEVVDGRLTYQYHKYQAALDLCKSKRVAIDVGAHVGLWSYFLARDFEDVISFEPMDEHADCFEKNIQAKNVLLHRIALGEREDFVSMVTHTANSSGDTGVSGSGKTPMITLDSMGLSDVDFIKIDCEGFEANVVTGAFDTIKRCKPVIIVEQKRDMSEARYGIPALEAVNILKSCGATLAREISGDYIMVW